MAESSQRGGRSNSPSLDRLVPSIGYVRGNVAVVSWKANRAKNNLTARELRHLAIFYTQALPE